MTEYTDDNYLDRAPGDPVGLSRFLLGGNRRRSAQSESIDEDVPADNGNDVDRPKSAEELREFSRDLLGRSH